MVKRKIILFGGSFDPIHNGHITVARHAIGHIGAEALVFIPAQRSPHKLQFPSASASDRFRMIELAIAGRKDMCISDCEIKRRPPSYTIDTTRYFRNEYGSQTELYWLVGGDMLEDLPRWHRIRELLDECNICLMLRPGFDKLQLDGFTEIFGTERVKKLQQNIITNPLVDISSTKIRQKITAGEDVSQLLPPAVLAYIKEHGLYAGAF